jgi:hypothetical protein
MPDPVAEPGASPHVMMAAAFCSGIALTIRQTMPGFLSEIAPGPVSPLKNDGRETKFGISFCQQVYDQSNLQMLRKPVFKQWARCFSKPEFVPPLFHLAG